MSRTAFTLIHGHDERQGTDTETGNQSAHGDLIPFSVRRGDLYCDADAQDDTPEGDGPFAADAVCDGGADKGADEGSNRQLHQVLALLSS